MPAECDPLELRRFAVELARLGGENADRLFGKVSVTRKEDQSPVTEADHVAQRVILKSLAERYPDHAGLVEEVVHEPERHARLDESPYCWVIDPIDGTRNFARGSRLFATSVAVLHQGSPVAGAIYDVGSCSIYSASRDGGATLDEMPLHVSNHAAGPDTIIAVGSFRRQSMPSAVRGWMERYHMRNQGVTCLHFAAVAAGLVDAAFSIDCKLWDVAAAALLIEEAGGLFTDDRGNPLWPMALDRYTGQSLQVLAAGPDIHRTLLASFDVEPT